MEIQTHHLLIDINDSMMIQELISNTPINYLIPLQAKNTCIIYIIQDYLASKTFIQIVCFEANAILLAK